MGRTKKEQIQTAIREDIFTMKLDISTPKHKDTWMLCDYEDFVKWRDNSEYGRIHAFQGKTYPYAKFHHNVGNVQKVIRFHRLVMGFPKEGIDHINRDGLDNRRENLRLDVDSINNRNRVKRSDNKSGFTGISWYKRYSKWHVKIKINSKKIHIGYYTDIDKAVKARIQAEIDHWGSIQTPEYINS